MTGSIQEKKIGLQTKFLFTITLINLITGLIIFFSLSGLQTREQTDKLHKEAALFSQISTPKIMNDFANHFYFEYSDKFYPSLRSLLRANENLLRIRIISKRNHTVLLDSVQATETQANSSSQPIALPAEIELQLRSQNIWIREATEGATQEGRPLLFVYYAYRIEGRDPLFYLEYLFSYESLRKSLQQLQKQILLGLLPAMGLGFLVALLFGRWVISPIRKLKEAVQQVSTGDYDVHLELRARDEVGDLVRAFNSMAGELKKKKELRKYLSDSTYRKVMESNEGVSAQLRGVRLEATVLFADIRGFVSLCENLEAEEITTMLNDYFTEMVDVIYRNGGEVDKFMGDALLAVFYGDDTLRAIHCALEMKEKLKEFNERRFSAGKSEIEIGIGIAHGEIISGPIGSQDRRDFTVIGDIVNLASRIEKISKQGRFTKVVFTDQVERRVKGLLDYESMPPVEIHGKEERVAIYELKKICDLNELISHIRRSDYDLKLRSIELLGFSRNEAAIPILIENLKDPNPEVRLGSVLALSRLSQVNDPILINAMLKCLKQESSERVIATLITGLGKICNTEQLLELAPFLNAPYERVIANTIEAIGKLKNPKGTDLILPFLDSLNNRIKANAAMAIFSSGHFEVVAVLKPMLMHSNPSMRASAAFALGELTRLTDRENLLVNWRSNASRIKRFLGEIQECVPMLVTLLKDPDPMVKRQSIIALGKIKDKSTILPLIDTLDSEKDQKELIWDVAQALQAIGSHQLVREVISKLV